MIAIPRNHLAQLIQAVFHDISIGLGPHGLESSGTPGRDLRLHENPVAVAIVEDTYVLWPVNTGEDTIQALQGIVVVGDPFVRFSHAKLWIAARHPFHTHESDG